jgi:L-asparagine permease
LVLLALDYPNGTYTVLSIPLVAGALMLGWSRAVRSKEKDLEGAGTPSHVGA